MSQKEIPQSYFKSKFTQIWRGLEETKEPVLVTKNGIPIIELHPYVSVKGLDPLHQLRGSVIEFVDPLTPVTE